MQKFYDYALYEEGYSKQTVHRYKQTLSFYCKVAHITEIEEVSLENVRNLFYFGRTNRNWSDNTFLCYYKSLRVFFRWCINNGYLESNPTDHIKQPKLGTNLPKALRRQQAEQILEVVDNYPFNNSFLRYRNYAIFATFIFSGIRKEELLNLKCTDVDIENQTLFVRQGKGKKDRMVPMNYRLAEALERYHIARKKAFKTCPEFFTSYTYNMGFTYSGLKRLVVKMRKATGIYFGNHILRHTFATLMLEGGCDLYSLSEMLGHSDIKTTTIYLGLSVEHLRKQVLKHPLN